MTNETSTMQSVLDKHKHFLHGTLGDLAAQHGGDKSVRDFLKPLMEDVQAALGVKDAK